MISWNLDFISRICKNVQTNMMIAMNICLFIGIYHIVIYYFIIIYDVMNISCGSTNGNGNAKRKCGTNYVIQIRYMGFIATVNWISFLLEAKLLLYK